MIDCVIERKVGDLKLLSLAIMHRILSALAMQATHSTENEILQRLWREAVGHSGLVDGDLAGAGAIPRELDGLMGGCETFDVSRYWQAWGE